MNAYARLKKSGIGPGSSALLLSRMMKLFVCVCGQGLFSGGRESFGSSGSGASRAVIESQDQPRRLSLRLLMMSEG
jgi:hypothetical protein